MTVPVISVPNVNQRERIPEEAIREVVEHIARNFQPDKIVLFVSYAYGQPHAGSDVDLLVVMPTPDGDWPLTRSILRSLTPFRFGIDLVVRSQQDIDKRIQLGDWFLEDVMTKGKIVYERARS